MASWFEFLKLEADLAMTFIVSAKIHPNPANAARSLRNAHRALEEIQHGLANPTTCYLSRDEVLFLERRCEEVKSALAIPPPGYPGPISDCLSSRHVGQRLPPLAPWRAVLRRLAPGWLVWPARRPGRAQAPLSATTALRRAAFGCVPRLAL
jgi:hypothetical protein